MLRLPRDHPWQIFLRVPVKGAARSTVRRSRPHSLSRVPLLGRGSIVAASRRLKPPPVGRVGLAAAAGSRNPDRSRGISQPGCRPLRDNYLPCPAEPIPLRDDEANRAANLAAGLVTVTARRRSPLRALVASLLLGVAVVGCATTGACHRPRPGHRRLGRSTSATVAAVPRRPRRRSAPSTSISC
jgi:hypothetical protein